MRLPTFIELPGIIALVVVGAVVLIGIAILLYFTIFAHMRYKRQVRELSSRFEYLHALLFGQDSQYIKRIEMISLTNLLYVNTHMTFNRRFKEIRDKSDSSSQTVINHLKDLVSDRDYKALKDALPAARATLEHYEEQVNALNTDLTAVVRPEEECRQASLQLKENLRKIKQDYYVKQADLSLVAGSFDQVFRRLDDKFVEYETYVESAQYEEAKAMLPALNDVIVQLSKALLETPNICVTIQSVIPDKLLSLENRYDEMVKAGYPLHHLMTRTSIEDMRRQLEDITKRVRQFDLRSVQGELDGILAQVDEFFDLFEKEKDARVTFDSECEGIYASAANVDKQYIRLCNALPEVRKIYIIPSEEQAKIDNIKVFINKAGATKRSLDTFIHSGTKQPYSMLVQKMHALRDDADQANSSIEDFSRYLMSLKSDSETGLATIDEYFAKCKDAEETIAKINLAAINVKYNPKLEEFYGYIDEIFATLKNLPIDVVKVNELVSTLRMEADATFAALQRDYEQMALADSSILFANRDRPHIGEINATLAQTEQFYFAGNFKRAYEETTAAVKRIRGE
ncbi:MAG: septation ring formation regulator EzrA [Bacilli bacterium]|nr:septation ring formation regulator EzrA [Bacilli bacterium]